MKVLNSFFIISLIFALSNALTLDSISSSKDSALVELQANPQSEAIFATIAVQLASPSGGFDRVIATLSDLINTTRHQQIQTTITWREQEKACEVSKYKLHERQEFFNGAISTLKDSILESETLLTEAKDLIHSRGYSIKEYNVILRSEKREHSQEKREIEGLKQNIGDAIFKTDLAINAVMNWTEGDDSVVYEKLKQVTYTYSKIIKFKVSIDKRFMTSGFKNKEVRSQLLIWLGELKIQFLDVQHKYRTLIETRTHLADSIETEIVSLKKDMKEDVRSLDKSIKDYSEDLKLLKEFKMRYDNLASENRDIVHANGQYCRNEMDAYNRMNLNQRASIKLYTNIRLYFKDNYVTLRTFLKDRYKSIH